MFVKKKLHTKKYFLKKFMIFVTINLDTQYRTKSFHTIILWIIIHIALDDIHHQMCLTLMTMKIVIESIKTLLLMDDKHFQTSILRAIATNIT